MIDILWRRSLSCFDIFAVLFITIYRLTSVLHSDSYETKTPNAVEIYTQTHVWKNEEIERGIL